MLMTSSSHVITSQWGTRRLWSILPDVSSSPSSFLSFFFFSFFLIWLRGPSVWSRTHVGVCHTKQPWHPCMTPYRLHVVIVRSDGCSHLLFRDSLFWSCFRRQWAENRFSLITELWDFVLFIEVCWFMWCRELFYRQHGWQDDGGCELNVLRTEWCKTSEPYLHIFNT